MALYLYSESAVKHHSPRFQDHSQTLLKVLYQAIVTYLKEMIQCRAGNQHISFLGNIQETDDTIQ
jgi:hypothetical protein